MPTFSTTKCTAYSSDRAAGASVTARELRLNGHSMTIGAKFGPRLDQRLAQSERRRTWHGEVGVTDAQLLGERTEHMYTIQAANKTTN